MKDYFSVLGVHRDASDDDIKRAYRTLAMKHHPDRGGDQAKFQEIQEAYEVLSNPQKRAEWHSRQHGPFANSPGGFSFNFGFPGGPGMDINEIFRSFHGSDPFTVFNQRQRKNRDLRVSIELELASTLEKQVKHISVQHLNGHRETVTVEIPRGITGAMQIKYAGQGDKSNPDWPPGDLYIEFRVKPDPRFSIEGLDLIHVIKLNCIEAIVGTSLKIESLDGTILNWSVPVGTQHGARFRIPHHGLWAVDQPFKGNLIVQVELVVPTNLSTEQLKALEFILDSIKENTRDSYKS